jgi:hypothetical protein
MTTEPLPSEQPAREILRRSAALRAARGVGVALPDFLVAFIFALFAVLPLLPYAWARDAMATLSKAGGVLFAGLIVEGTFLMFQATIVDIATRLSKRPPLWAVLVIGGGILLFYPEALGVVVDAWKQGAAVLIPLVVSLIDRLAILWRMPGRSTVERMAARALIGNRILAAIGVGIVFVLIMVANMLEWMGEEASGSLFSASIALYFALGAYDEWRVRRPRFAENPRVLLGYDILGVKYLEKV